MRVVSFQRAILVIMCLTGSGCFRNAKTVNSMEEAPPGKQMAALEPYGGGFGKIVYVEGVLLERDTPSGSREFRVDIKKINHLEVKSPLVLDVVSMIHGDLWDSWPSNVAFLAFETGGFEGVPVQARNYGFGAGKPDFHFHDYLQGPIQ